MSGTVAGNRRESSQKVTGQGEALAVRNAGAESVMVEFDKESLASERLLEEVLEKENLERALRRVKANRGAPGVDGMTVEELPRHLRDNWTCIKAQWTSDTYGPNPVRSVNIPKPKGGVRKLGIPTVLHRFIQQAILQILLPHYDPRF